MKRKMIEKQAFLAICESCLLVLGSLWLVDGIFRLVNHTFSDKKVLCIDERFAETETEAETESAFSPLKKDSDEITIREANLALTGLPAGYTTERKQEKNICQGMLVCSEEIPPAENLGDFQNKNEYYHLKNMELKIQESAVIAMNALAEAYFQETGRADLLVYSTSELYEADASMYPDFLPDRSTGFCLDLAFLNDDGTISSISDSNADWLKQNAFRFGFVFSVPDTYYHIRYVGAVHAAVMQKEQISLKEYLEILRNYSVSAPYECMYEKHQIIIYFVPAAAFGYTDVPFPENSGCQISGNGKDGYIVQADLNYE